MSELSALRILIVEDDEEDRMLLRETLAKIGLQGDRLHWLDDFDGAKAAIERREHDVCLVDYQIGADDGMKLLRVNACQPRARPMIVLTGFEDPDVDREMQRLGAADCLAMHGLHADLLGRSIRYATERQRVLDALREGEDRYRALFEGNPLPMWLQEVAGGRILEVNDAAVRVYGFSRSRFAELDPARDLGAEAEGLAVRRAGRHRRHDGSPIDVEVTTNDFMFEGRKVRLVLSEVLSATALSHEAETRYESTLHAVLEDSADELVVVAADRTVLYLNAAARRKFGSAAVVDAPLPLVGDWTSGRSTEFVLNDANGDERTLELRVSATEWDGQPAQLLAIRDLTERRGVEQGLQLSRRAMEASANGILIVDAADPAQPLIYVNPAFERITGYCRGEALGRNCSFLQGGDRAQAAMPRLREGLARGEDTQVVLRNYRKDGALFWNELTISPVRNAAGALTHFVGVLNEVTEQRAYEGAALHGGTHDGLTGLPNRALLLDRLRQTLMLTRRHGGTPALLLVDLDQFKEINDMLGYRAGDVVLKEIVLRMAGCLRESDTMARLVGDEFVLLVPDLVRQEDAALIATKLLAAVSQPYLIEGQTLFCSCSIGITHATGFTDDAPVLIRQAGLAMVAAKRAGRNTFHFYNGELAQPALDRFELRTLLPSAIAQQEFELYFQPQMDLASRRICGVEALVRWRHPVLGQIGPAHFVPVAEQTGQIVAIGAWVLDEACRQHRRWLGSGLLDCPVTVNISAVQFQRFGFVEEVVATLNRHALPGERLELELTESLAMDPSGAALATLRRLRELGVRLAIGNFGTGYSNLARLRSLPIDKLKIDRSFVGRIMCDSEDASITLSVIAIARHLRFRVTAEGVETAAQLAYLKRHRCDEVQGFLISRPLPSHELERFLTEFGLPRAGADTAERATSTLLLVDDEPSVLRALTRTLQRDGYRILTASSAADAFVVLAQNEVHVVLSDQRMPQMCGTHFLSLVRSLHPDTVRLVLGAYADLHPVTEAINRGAVYRFLIKPWADAQLRAHIREAFAHQQRRRHARRDALERGAWTRANPVSTVASPSCLRACQSTGPNDDPVPASANKTGYP